MQNHWTMKYRSQWPTLILRSNAGSYWFILPKYDVYTSNSLQDIRQNHWTVKYRSCWPSLHDHLWPAVCISCFHNRKSRLKLGSKYDLTWYPLQTEIKTDLLKYTISTIIYQVQLSENGKVKNPVSLSKKFFFSVSHLQYACNIYAKCWKDPVKALRGVDFIKYALWTIIYLVQLSENGYSQVKNPVSFSKNIFLHQTSLCTSSIYRRLSLTRLCITWYYHLRQSDSSVQFFFHIYLLQFDYA